MQIFLSSIPIFLHTLMALSAASIYQLLIILLIALLMIVDGQSRQIRRSTWQWSFSNIQLTSLIINTLINLFPNENSIKQQVHRYIE